MPDRLLSPRTEQTLWGACYIHEDDPFVRERTRVYYAPHVEGGPWGIFDAENQIVQSTIDYWLPERLPLRQVHSSPYLPSQVTRTLPDGPEYVYGGRYTDHFGHFLIETLSRLWPLTGTGLRRGQKLVMHGPKGPAWWWRHRYVRDVFGALNITPDDIVHADEPFWIPHLIIPRPSFGAQDFAHRAFIRLGHYIGGKLMKGRLPRPNWRPAYLAKTRLPNGVRRIMNEDRIVEVMQRAGVEIFHPERLPILEMMKLLASRSVVGGTVTSAHHLCMFVEEASRFELLSPSEHLNSNFFLFDRLNRNRAFYYHPAGVRDVTPENPTFLVYHELDDPVGVARALLRKL
jgi:hypothetical protein